MAQNGGKEINQLKVELIKKILQRGLIVDGGIGENTMLDEYLIALNRLNRDGNGTNELARIARSLAQNCGYHVFPCTAERKMPCWSKRDGGKGFYQATTDPVEIERLFAHRNAELIAVRAGETSGVSILDIDVKHNEARAWWIKHEARLPRTRTYRTRSGGLHLLFRHAHGVRNSESKPIKGVDSRGEGGYFIFWFAHGFECLDNSPPATWPAWLSEFFRFSPLTEHARSKSAESKFSDAKSELIRKRAIDAVRDAPEGTRHNRIRNSALLLGGIQARTGFSDEMAIGWLLNSVGLTAEKKARDTVSWGLENGRQKPLEIGGQP